MLIYSWDIFEGDSRDQNKRKSWCIKIQVEAYLFSYKQWS